MLFGLAPIISKGLESVRSIGEGMTEPDVELNEGKLTVTEVRGEIEFRSVGHTFTGAARPAVTGIDLLVRPGETVAIVGPSGAGKSTVLNLLLGFLRPTEGRIRLDGLDMADVDLRSYRRFLSVVPQESLLFDGTVAENVTYGLPDVPPEVLASALRDANAEDFVAALPRGVDTPIGDRGNQLSGGQRQRLAIARALLRRPHLLVFDEATSSLDSLTEEDISRTIRDVATSGDAITILIAHRLSTVMHADRIYVLTACGLR
jgi:ATP-binding cassette subfamily B protein